MEKHYFALAGLTSFYLNVLRFTVESAFEMTNISSIDDADVFGLEANKLLQYEKFIRSSRQSLKSHIIEHLAIL